MRGSGKSVHQMGTQDAKRTMRCASKLDVVAGKREHHDYGYAGKDAWANEQSQRYMQEMDEVFHQGITNELYQSVLERSKIVQDQIEHGSDMKGLKRKAKKKVWTVGNENRRCSSCGIYVSDKLQPGGTQRFRGARNTTAKFNGQCCSCRFDVSTIDWMESCVTARHSCHTCKRRRHEWAAIFGILAVSTFWRQPMGYPPISNRWA